MRHTPAFVCEHESDRRKTIHMILLLFLFTLAIGFLAQWQVKRAYARHSHTPVQSGYTGAEAAHEILGEAGITDVEIVTQLMPQSNAAKGHHPS